ncbi:MAG: hypothetical protein NTU53_14055, partial [Planctomycetota bacterium]|nr:hypothetical protein [Planctomycetota bacterium]
MHYIERIFCGVILLPAILQTASAQYQGWQHSGSIYLLTTPEGANLPASASEDGFADVFWPMFTSGFEARRKLGADYAVAGKDGVHPGWAGHVLMAYVYLQSMGLDGEIATINQAAQVLQPGQRVIVAAGVYRERLRPARGGSGPEAMISYEAAPGAQVVLKGSRVFREMWVRVEADAGASV